MKYEEIKRYLRKEGSYLKAILAHRRSIKDAL
jgi:hypothetical protein